MVGARLPKALVADLEKIEQIEQSDRSTILRKLLARAVANWKLEYSAQEYGRGAMSLGRAAEEAGVSIWEMMDYLYIHKIPYQYDLEALREDMQAWGLNRPEKTKRTLAHRHR